MGFNSAFKGLAGSQKSLTGLTNQALLIHCFAQDFSKNCALLVGYTASNGSNGSNGSNPAECSSQPLRVEEA